MIMIIIINKLYHNVREWVYYSFAVNHLASYNLQFTTATEIFMEFPLQTLAINIYFFAVRLLHLQYYDIRPKRHTARFLTKYISLDSSNEKKIRIIKKQIW